MPSVALACAARETLHMGDVVERMLRQAMTALMGNDRKLAAEVSPNRRMFAVSEQNERRQCDSKTKRKHAEEDTRPQELICMLPCSLARGGPPNLAARPEQHACQEDAAQDHADDVSNIEVLDRAYEEKTKHKRSNRSAIGIGEELAEGGGVSAHCGAANDILMEGDLFAISLSRRRS